jgi:hypothetical protein
VEGGERALHAEGLLGRQSEAAVNFRARSLGFSGWRGTKKPQELSRGPAVTRVQVFGSTAQIR